MTMPATGSTVGQPAPVPVARRLQQPSWRDVRLLLGLALVLVSVVTGALVVTSADRTTPTYAAAHALVPGAQLALSDLAVVGSRISGGPSHYLRADRSLAPGLVVVRPVLAGELVPLTAVGGSDQVALRPVTVPVTPEIADELRTGMVVDVWVAQHRDEGERGYAEPQRLATSAAIGERATRRGALGTSSTTAVQVLVGPEVVPLLIHAVDDDARVTLVPVPTSGVGTDS